MYLSHNINKSKLKSPRSSPMEGRSHLRRGKERDLAMAAVAYTIHPVRKRFRRHIYAHVFAQDQASEDISYERLTHPTLLHR